VTRVSPHPSIVRFPRRVKLGKRDASAYPSKAEQLTPPANFAEVPVAEVNTIDILDSEGGGFHL